VNRRWCEYTGLSLEAACGSGCLSTIHPDDAQRWLSYWRSLLGSAESGEVEARLRRFDWTFRWFLIRAAPLRDESVSTQDRCVLNREFRSGAATARLAMVGGSAQHDGARERILRGSQVTFGPFRLCLEQRVLLRNDIPVRLGSRARHAGDTTRQRKHSADRLCRGADYRTEQYARALELAETQSSLSWALRAATANLLAQPDDAAARATLADIHERSTEGFDMPDLALARRLLEGSR
jgi:PAS domain-containing protein